MLAVSYKQVTGRGFVVLCCKMC